MESSDIFGPPFEIRDYNDGSGLFATRDIYPDDAIMAIPFSELISLPNIQKQNGLVWKMVTEKDSGLD
jgi:hypothetical protein